MKIVVEYLEKALDFEALAANEIDPKLKESLLQRHMRRFRTTTVIVASEMQSTATPI